MKTYLVRVIEGGKEVTIGYRVKSLLELLAIIKDMRVVSYKDVTSYDVPKTYDNFYVNSRSKLVN